MVPEKIGIIAGDKIGDALITLPLIKGLRNTYPRARITLIFQREGIGKDILMDNCGASGAVSFGIDHKNSLTNIKKIIWTVFYLTKEKFDILIDAFPSTSKTAFLSLILRARKKIGTKWFLNKLSCFYDHAIECEGKKSLEINKEIFFHVTGGIKGYDENFKIQLKKNRFVDDIFSDKKEYIALFLGYDNDIGRNWNLEKWKALLEMIYKNNKNVKFVAVGSSMEKRRVEELKGKLDFEIIDMAGKLGIYGTAYLVSKCDMFLGTDGGPVHIAGSMGIPSLVIMGNSPLQWESFSSIRYIRSGKECHKYCWKLGRCKFQTGNLTCTDFISPEAVFQVFRGLFKRKK